MLALICHRLQDINSRNLHDLDPDLYNGERSNVNMLIERPRATFVVLEITVCPTFHRLRDVRPNSLNVHGRHPDLLNGQGSNVNSQSKDRSVLAIATLVPSVTVCEIITFELQRTLFESLTF